MMKIFFVLTVFVFSAAAVHAQQQVEYARVLAESVWSADRIVKNAPFSGEAVNESIQTLGDGNRIIRRSSTKLFRDSEGRYRREEMPKQIGLPGAVDVETPQSIFILDPVAGFRYTINPKNSTVRKTPFRYAYDLKMATELTAKLKVELDRVKVYTEQADKERKAAVAQDPSQAANVEVLKEKMAERAKVVAMRKDEMEKRIKEKTASAVTLGPLYKVSSKYETKTENLGTQNVEGVQAEGTRSTTTIPAGAVGNERPIEIVYERWYSNDLKMIVVSKHNDPRVGEQTYRLTNIRRGEPDSGLFSPPADYKLIESGQPRAVIVKPLAPNVVAIPVVKVAPSAKTMPAPAAQPARVDKPQN